MKNPERPVVIYNLFPRLAGPFKDWRPHLERARDMGFNWLFVNPVQQSGYSGSMYAIQDYYRIDPLYLDPQSRLSSGDQLKETIATARSLGLKVMIDLVVNHTSFDCVLVDSHPDWYRRDESGDLLHPGAPDTGVVWEDLAIIDNAGSADRENLWKYWEDLVAWFLSLGIEGFRCDAAYQVPNPLWERLIRKAKKSNPEVMFFAESLGCGFDCIITLAKAGFDFNFNSSKWWDMREPWALEQHEENRVHGSPSISFPESHDTVRLAAELKGNVQAVKMRYLLSTVFSSGVMTVSGFEFCFRKKPDVVRTRPEDWEKAGCDLRDFIKAANSLKTDYRVFREEGRIDVVSTSNPAIFAFRKVSGDGKQAALAIFNLDAKSSRKVGIPELSEAMGGAERIRDVSVEGRRESVGEPFEAALDPSQVVFLLGEKRKPAENSGLS